MVGNNAPDSGNAIKTMGEQDAFPLADFTKVVTLGLIGACDIIRLAAERIARTEQVGEERGDIINTVSVTAFDGQIGRPPTRRPRAASSA